MAEKKPVEPPVHPAGERTADDAPATRPGYRVEALAKGLRLLSVFTERRPTWRISDIVAEVGMPLPTVYRLVMTLTSEGYLEHLPNGEYRPGVRVLTLGHAALHSLDLVALATPRLQGLADATGETVNLCVLTRDRVLYLVRLRNSDLVTANVRVGSTLPAVHTSIGKLLLAHLEDEDLQRRITSASFAANAGPNAKHSIDDLQDELAEVRREGWALQDQELAFGLRSVAAPVRDDGGRVVAGVNIAVHAGDWPRDRVTRILRPAVVAAAEDISRLLGWGRSRDAATEQACGRVSRSKGMS